MDMLLDVLDSDDTGLISYEDFVHYLHRMKCEDDHGLLVSIKHNVLDIKKQVLENQISMKEKLESSLEIKKQVLENQSNMKEKLDTSLQIKKLFLENQSNMNEKLQQGFVNHSAMLHLSKATRDTFAEGTLDSS